MRIAIIGTGMDFNENTLHVRGLGGSETAQLCMGRELAKLGVEVYQYCHLRGRPGKTADGIFYQDVTELGAMPEVDVAIISRLPGYISHIPGKAKLHYLWIHDVACVPDYPLHLPRRSEGFHEIWSVSRWQAHQWARALQPLYKDDPADAPRIWVTRNGIPRVDITTVDARVPRRLVFASRPERGLWPLIRPGGIMSYLPDYQLHVAGYNDRPAKYQEFYARIDHWMNQPNIVDNGSMKAASLRHLIASASAYVLPTNFLETSCILARECIEQQTPMIMTESLMSGAVPETLGDCQVIGSFATHDSDQFCREFADTVRKLDSEVDWARDLRSRMLRRSDLYWDDVARSWLARILDAGVI